MSLSFGLNVRTVISLRVWFLMLYRMYRLSGTRERFRQRPLIANGAKAAYPFESLTTKAGTLARA
jgi:hypothetical protein